MSKSSSSPDLNLNSKVLNCTGKEEKKKLSFLQASIHPLLGPTLFLIYLTAYFFPKLYDHRIKQFNQKLNFQDNKSVFHYANYDNDGLHSESMFNDANENRAFCAANHDQYICVSDHRETPGVDETLRNKRHLHKTTGKKIGSHANDAVYSATSSSKKETDDNEIAFEQAVESLSHLNIGVPQRIDGSDAEKEAVKQVLIQTEKYFRDEVLMHPVFYRYVRELGVCQNTNELCAFWTSVGECESNRGFMLSHCSASCQLCALLFMNLNTIVN